MCAPAYLIRSLIQAKRECFTHPETTCTALPHYVCEHTHMRKCIYLRILGEQYNVIQNFYYLLLTEFCHMIIGIKL